MLTQETSDPRPHTYDSEWGNMTHYMTIQCMLLITRHSVEPVATNVKLTTASCSETGLYKCLFLNQVFRQVWAIRFLDFVIKTTQCLGTGSVPILKACCQRSLTRGAHLNASMCPVTVILPDPTLSSQEETSVPSTSTLHGAQPFLSSYQILS